MGAVTPLRSVADRYAAMDEVEIGTTAAGGYGVQRRKQFVSDVREICRLAKIAENAIARGEIR